MGVGRFLKKHVVVWRALWRGWIYSGCIRGWKTGRLIKKAHQKGYDSWDISFPRGSSKCCSFKGVSGICLKEITIRCTNGCYLLRGYCMPDTLLNVLHVAQEVWVTLFFKMRKQADSGTCPKAEVQSALEARLSSYTDPFQFKVWPLPLSVASGQLSISLFVERRF